MAKIPDMTAASALTGAEQIEVVQSGNTRRTTAQDVADLAASGLVEADIDTLAKLNAIVTDATLDGASDARTPASHGNEAHDDDYVASDDVSSIVLVEEGDWPPDPEVSGVLYVKVEDSGS